MNKRTHIVIPDDLVEEIDAMVGKRGRSQFLAAAARKELKLLRALQELDRATGAWKDDDHPELHKGSARWVEALRKSEEKRLS